MHHSAIARQGPHYRSFFLALLAALIMLASTHAALAWRVQPSKSTYAPGEAITINFANFSDPRDWISIVPAGSAANKYVEGYWTYIDRDIGTHQFKGLPAGTYEVRAYCCWGSSHGGYQIRAQARFVVGTASSEGPSDSGASEASVGGKYSGLIQRLTCPADRKSYGEFRDWGYWNGGKWCGQTGKAGYWVWVAPTWYVWQNRR